MSGPSPTLWLVSLALLAVASVALWLYVEWWRVSDVLAHPDFISLTRGRCWQVVLRSRVPSDAEYFIIRRDTRAAVLVAAQAELKLRREMAQLEDAQPWRDSAKDGGGSLDGLPLFDATRKES